MANFLFLINTGKPCRALNSPKIHACKYKKSSLLLDSSKENTKKERKKMQFKKRKIAIGFIAALGFFASTNVNIFSDIEKKNFTIDRVLSDTSVENETVSFNNVEMNPNEVIGTYSLLSDNYSTPENPQTRIRNVEAEKVADFSQKYRPVDEVLYTMMDANIYASDDENSKLIQQAVYGDYIHKIGDDPYTEDGFSKIEINGQEAYIKTKNLTDQILFKEKKQEVYAKQEVVVYTEVEMQNELTKVNRLDSMDLIGESKDIYRVYINDTVGYVLKEGISTEMVFDESNMRVWATSKVSIKTAPDDNSESISVLYKNDGIQRVAISKEWSKVTINGSTGYIRTEFLTTVRPISKGEEIAQYALQFVGNPYVYGGTSLTHGADCSGFVQSVYAHFGYSLNRTATTQMMNGRSVSYSNIQPGDLIFYSGHVAIYIGNGQIVHASNSRPYPEGGIKVSPATYTTIIGVRRIV